MILKVCGRTSYLTWNIIMFSRENEFSLGTISPIKSETKKEQTQYTGRSAFGEEKFHAGSDMSSTKKSERSAIDPEKAYRHTIEKPDRQPKMSLPEQSSQLKHSSSSTKEQQNNRHRYGDLPLCYLDEAMETTAGTQKSTYGKIKTAQIQSKKSAPLLVLDSELQEKKSHLQSLEQPKVKSYSISFKQEGLELIPKGQNKISTKDNKWSFSFTPTVATLETNSHYIYGQDKKGNMKLNAGFKAKGSLLDLGLRVHSPAYGEFNHNITFGGTDISIGLRFNLDEEDSLAGIGVPSKVLLDLFETSYDYKTPVLCFEETGWEFKTGASLGWGWRVDRKLDVSLTEFEVPFPMLSLPGPLRTQFKLEGYARVIRTPHHPECQLAKKDNIFIVVSTKPEKSMLLLHDELSESSLDSRTEKDSDNNSSRPTLGGKLSVPHSAHSVFFKPAAHKLMHSSHAAQLPQLHKARLQENYSKPEKKCLLNEHSNVPETQKARQFLNEPYEAQRVRKLFVNPVKTSFLQEDYVAPEAQIAAMKLAAPVKTSFLQEDYVAPEARIAAMKLVAPVKTSFLQEDYVAPEARIAAMKLAAPGNSSQQFFSPKRLQLTNNFTANKELSSVANQHIKMQ